MQKIEQEVFVNPLREARRQADESLKVLFDAVKKSQQNTIEH